MKKLLSIMLVSAVTITSLVSLSACSQLDVAEQPDPVVVYAEKIYPSAIGNCLTDPSVNVPAIDAYMEEYNKNADETAVINYDTIKYNKDADYYYVNDNSTNVGIKFRLDQSKAIVSASIYTGTLEQTTKNVYNIVINAIQTSGYKSLMTAEDKAIIQHTVNGFNGVSSSKNDVQQIFNGQENFAAKWQNNVAEFEIPVKPDELPKPDTSHTLADITMPTVEVPGITIDTTITEGTHLDNGEPVTQKDITSVVGKIENASSQIASVQKHNQTTPEGVNDVLDDLVVNATIRETGKSLTTANTTVSKLASSEATKGLPTTETLSREIANAYAEFASLTRPSTSNTATSATHSASALVSGISQTKDTSSSFASTIFNQIVAAQTQVQKNVNGYTTLEYIETPNNKPTVTTLEYRDGSSVSGTRASEYAVVSL